MSENIYYESLKFPEDGELLSFKSGEKNEIRGLSQINVFIGSNNSGKSRLLRNIFLLKEPFFTTNLYSGEVFYAIAKDLNNQFNGYLSSTVYHYIDFINIDYIKNQISDQDFYIEPNNPIYKKIYFLVEQIKNANFSNLPINNNKHGFSRPQNYEVKKFFLSVLENERKNLESVKPMKIIGFQESYYFPILRGLRSLENLGDIYIKRTSSDYFHNVLDSTKKIFTGLEFFKILEEHLLGEPEQRELIRDYQSFLSREFFDGQEITLIPKKGDSVVYVKIGNEKQFPIYHLGDGLQNLIILTFPVFTATKPTLFFMEEPDTHMHPGYQRKLLEVFQSHRQHQFFFTTHSNHFLDMILDDTNISVYRIEKKLSDKTEFQIHLSKPKDTKLLTSLGVNKSSVFLSNSTIWVEGITDRLYLRVFLKRFIDDIKDENHVYKTLKEDIYYSFIEYQGSNIEHWKFSETEQSDEAINAIFSSARGILIADGDISKNIPRVTRLQQQLQNKFLLLSVKEIENLIPQELVREAISTLPKFAFDLQEIKFSEYSKKDIGMGYYIWKTFGASLSTFAVKSGQKKLIKRNATIQKKVDFCKLIVKIINDEAIDWKLNPELQDICKRILDHIVGENQGL